MLSLRRRYIVCIAVIAGQFLFGQSSFVIDPLHKAEDRSDLLPYTYFIDLPAKKLVPAQNILQQLPINHDHLFFLSVENRTADTVKKVLQFGGRYVTAKTISLYSADGNIRKHVLYRSNSLAFTLRPHERSFVLFEMAELDRADPKRLSVNLFSLAAFEKKKESTYREQCFFLGLFLFLVIFNTIVFFVTRWKVYLKYAVYILSALLYFAYYFGIVQEAVPALNSLSVNIAYTWYSLIFITYFYFLNDFGDYRQYVPRAHLLLNIGIAFKSGETITNTLLHLFGFNFIYTKTYINTVIGLEIVLMIFILFYILKNKNIRGRLVVLASLMLIVMAIIEQTKLFPEVDSAYFVEAGIVAELLTFSVGLGYVTKLYYDEKRSTELLYVRQLVANEKLQKEHMEKLEALVLQRTEELKAEKVLVEKKNSENELLLAEIHHRVKNNLQVVSSLLSLQEKSMLNNDARNAIREGKERIRSMELVHKMLYRTNTYSGIEMREYVLRLSEGLIDSFGRKEQSELSVCFDPIVLDVDTAIPLGLILNELIVNSLKHGKPGDGKLQVRVELQDTGSELVLKIGDNGKGKPDQVQGLDSFGMRIVQSLIRQLNGEIHISAKEGLHYSISLKSINFNPHENKSSDRRG